MLRMTHPDAGTATCVDTDQFAAVHEPRGWSLDVDDDGRLIHADDPNPTSHITPDGGAVAEPTSQED